LGDDDDDGDGGGEWCSPLLATPGYRDRVLIYIYIVVSAQWRPLLVVKSIKQGGEGIVNSN
jgi:hypothetical protein